MKKSYAYAVVFFLASLAVMPGRADEPHPTIHHAIASLEQTKDELEKGEYGFGGHRSKAIEHIDQALSELHQALEFADANPGEIKHPEEAH